MKKIASVLLAAGLMASTIMADTSGGGTTGENNTSVGGIVGAVGTLLVVGVAIAASNDSANTTPSHTTTHQ